MAFLLIHKHELGPYMFANHENDTMTILIMTFIIIKIHLKLNMSDITYNINECNITNMPLSTVIRKVIYK